MTTTNINEMQQALIRRGLSPAQVSAMSGEQLITACSEKLQASLSGNIEGYSDNFVKDLKYNIEFPVDGEKIKVAKLSTKTLPSGRKVEAFVDIAGNQYFQYRSADNKVLDEKYFKEKENLGSFEKFQIQDNKLVILDMFGVPKTVFENNKAEAAVLKPEWAEKNPTKILNKQAQDSKFRAHLNSLPEVKADYTELMRSIRFRQASKEEQIDMMLDNVAERYLIAEKQGNKKEMVKLLVDGFSLGFQKFDMKLGITQSKDAIKEYSGLNALVDIVNELVDDGNEENLTALEKAWEAVKGVGDAADSFIGTQGVATIGAIALAAEASVAAAAAAGYAKAGQIIVAAMQAYFGYEGASLVIEGTSDIINAESKEEARGGGAKVGMGGVMLYGTYKSFKAGYNAYKANKLAMQEQQALVDGAKKVLDIPEGTDIIETVLKDAYKKAALKTHPDKGGSVEAFDAVKDAYELLKGTVGTNTNFKSQITKENANPELFGVKAKASMVVTRANGTQIDILNNIPQTTLQAPTQTYLSMPKATTVEPNFGVTIKQAKASPVEAKRIVFADTVEETLRVNNENGIPLKFEANPEAGEAPYFYKDAPYGGRQKVNTRSVEVTYTHEATADWGLTPEYVKEYADSKGFCPDRAVVAAGDDAATGLKGNIAEKQYEVINPDGTRSPLVVDNLKPGQVVNIIKKEGVELKMAVFDKPTVSLEGETLPAGKLMMVDSEGHPYNGNPVKRLKSGEVTFDFDMNDPRQAQMKADLDAVVKLEADAKAAKKAGNKDLAGQLNTQAKELTGKLETELTDFVKSAQNPQQKQ